ncbi:MAG: ATPase, T2SS/T4P/T4SS family, partial [Candidatus Aenigmatarchaeota archaeon]
MTKDKFEKRILPDTSVVIDNKLSEFIEEGKIDNVEIIIPEMVLDELQSQANRGLEVGFEGLDEVKRLRELAENKNIKITHTGRRPTMEEIRLAKKGRIDALIRDAAEEHDAVLYTADLVQAEVGKAEGLEVVFIEKEKEEEKLLFEKYFTEDTMSIHLKDGSVPHAKRGEPGNFELEELEEVEMDREAMERFSRNIIQVSRQRDDAQTEISKKGAEVIQLGRYRIVIAKPPFSKGMEITIVRPIVKLTLDDYDVSDKLKNRLEEKAEGILIAGPPGSGKTTLGQALAEFYSERKNVVKTLESPRDLDVSSNITQYTELEGRMDNSADILLLVRPDYTIYDEI